MAQTDAMTDSFLAGQGIPVDLRHVETELTKLWGPAAEQAGGPELENPHVTRIVLANLVVECLVGECESLAGCSRRSSRGSPAGRSCSAGRTTPGVGSRPRSRRFATCRPRACRRSAPSGSCSGPGRMRST